jgi:hypothetical protein
VIETQSFEEIIQIRMSRKIGGKPAFGPEDGIKTKAFLFPRLARNAEITREQSECARGRREEERNNGIRQHGGRKLVFIVA